MDIVKDSGERQVFAHEKFRRSLELAGASQELVDKVSGAVTGELTQGSTTRDISHKTRDYLALEDIEVAARYGLKRGIMELGPAGFLFEQYIAALLHEYGYRTRHGVMMQGECVTHEVDVVAENDTTHYLLELKYHNTHAVKTHIDVVMYAWARLQDIAPQEEIREHHTGKKHEMWLITNTKFTHNAIQYANCKGVRLTGWTYPHADSLERLILEKRLYPVTVLPAINAYALEQFSRHNLMFAKDLADKSALDLVKQFDIHVPVAERIVHETQELMRGRYGRESRSPTSHLFL